MLSGLVAASTAWLPCVYRYQTAYQSSSGRFVSISTTTQTGLDTGWGLVVILGGLALAAIGLRAWLGYERWVSYVAVGLSLGLPVVLGIQTQGSGFVGDDRWESVRPGVGLWIGVVAAVVGWLAVLMLGRRRVWSRLRAGDSIDEGAAVADGVSVDAMISPSDAIRASIRMRRFWLIVAFSAAVLLWISPTLVSPITLATFLWLALAPFGAQIGSVVSLRYAADTVEVQLDGKACAGEFKAAREVGGSFVLDRPKGTDLIPKRAFTPAQQSAFKALLVRRGFLDA